MARDDIFGSWSKRYTIGTNNILQIPAISGQNAITIKLITGGTLEVGGSTLVGQTFGDMYFLGANEALSCDMSGTFYLWASGATCTCTILRGRSAGQGEVTPAT